jgi:hypothetical protein
MLSAMAVQRRPHCNTAAHRLRRFATNAAGKRHGKAPSASFRLIGIIYRDVLFSKRTLDSN